MREKKWTEKWAEGKVDRIPCGQIPVWVQHSKQNLLRPSLHYRQTETVIQIPCDLPAWPFSFNDCQQSDR